jgi:hypothetical protein
MASGGQKGVGAGFAAFNGADGFGQGALVGRGEEGVGPDDFEGKSVPDDGLFQKQTDGGGEVEAYGGKQFVGIATEVGIESDLEGGGAHNAILSCNRDEM